MLWGRILAETTVNALRLQQKNENKKIDNSGPNEFRCAKLPN